MSEDNAGLLTLTVHFEHAISDQMVDAYWAVDSMVRAIDPYAQVELDYDATDHGVLRALPVWDGPPG